MTYILILSLLSYTTQTGYAIAAVPGFKSTAECLQAGNAWIESVKGKGNAVPSAICVAQSKP